MTEKALRVMGLTRRYKRNCGIFNMTFDVERGEIIGIYGGELSGKTTLLRVIAGLCIADSGQVSVMGHDALREHELAALHLGTVIEEPTFYDYMTAEQNMRIVARLYKNVNSARVDEVLENMGLGLCRKVKVREFSPSMRMKLAIGEAILSNPRIVLLDEPFRALSEKDGEILKKIVLDMNYNYGTTFVISSRNVEVFEDFCDKIGVIENGRLTAFDIHKNIIERELEEGERLFEQSVEEEQYVRRAEKAVTNE